MIRLCDHVCLSLALQLRDVEPVGSELYLPTAELQQLDVPTICWRGGGPSPKECELLVKLGIREQVRSHHGGASSVRGGTSRCA